MRRRTRQPPRLSFGAGTKEVADTSVLDLSDVITDLEQLRHPASDAARVVMQEARLTTGTIKNLAQGRTDTVFRMNPYDLHMKPGWNVAREMDDPETIAHIDWLARDITNVGVKQAYRIY